MDNKSMIFIHMVCPLDQGEEKGRDMKKLLIANQAIGYTVVHESSNVFALNGVSFFSHFVRMELHPKDQS